MFKTVQRIFLTGLAVILPLLVTIFIIRAIFRFIDSFLGPYVGPLLIRMGLPLSKEFFIPGLGAILAMTLIFLVGLVTTNYFGKKIWETGERLVEYIPGVRTVYLAVKQLIETFSVSEKAAFRKVALIEYPRKGIWALGFVTAKSVGEIEAHTRGEELTNVFVPTTPNPTSGFLLMIPARDLIELEMSVEDGIKFVVSAGILPPEHSAPRNSQIKQRSAAESTADPRAGR